MWAYRAATPALRTAMSRPFAYNSQVQLTFKQKMGNVAVATLCISFIGTVYGFSINKMKTAGDDVSEEIALHEATMKAVRESAPPPTEEKVRTTAISARFSLFRLRHVEYNAHLKTRTMT